MCDHKRKIVLSAKCSDCSVTTVPHLNIEKEGYVPHIKGLGGGDYIDIAVCLDCYTVLNLEDLTDEELKEILE